MYSELEYNTFAMSSLKDATMNLNSNIIWFASLKYKETENYCCKTVFFDQQFAKSRFRNVSCYIILAGALGERGALWK